MHFIDDPVGDELPRLALTSAPNAIPSSGGSRRMKVRRMDTKLTTARRNT
jgi:hypothetical protein